MPNHAAGAVRQGTRFVCLSIVPQFGEECKRKLRLLPSGPQKLQCVCFKPGNVTPAYLEQLCRFQLGQGRLTRQPVPQQNQLVLPGGMSFNMTAMIA